MRIAYPFSAIVGQDEMKLALLLAATDQGIGGVMVFGDRGTGKSTAVRALAALLPPIAVSKGCAFHCDPKDGARRCVGDCGTARTRRSAQSELMSTPVVDLPLGATEDRVVGALDLELALTRGEKRFEPGLLARAHRGFLYIDEVNLLEDHLVDLLIDVAASGVNLVEREGLSVRHPARFVLVGSGNPEEGDLRPQLLDRFGLSVEIRTPKDLEQRIEIVRRRDAFERNAAAFIDLWKRQETQLRRRIVAARTQLSRVEISDEALKWAARLCMGVGTDGLRGELTLARAARALAALRGRRQVQSDDLMDMAPAALRHRLRRDPMDETGSSARIERAMRQQEAALA